MRNSSLVLCCFLLSLIAGCRTLRDLRYDYLSDVTTVSAQRTQTRRFTLFPFEMKNPGIAAMAGSNLSDNLALQLRRLGYYVAEVEKPTPPLVSEVPPPLQNPEPLQNTDGEPAEETEKTAPLQPQTPPPATVPTPPQIDIPELLKKNKTPAYITGYVYETRTGSLLDEQVSTGVLLRILDEHGELLAQIRYIGDNTLDSYESTAGVARVLAARIQSLTQ